jgi:DNA-binding CsgD family transcriptional regulator
MNATDKRLKLRDKMLNEREQLVVRLREEEKLTCREIGVRLGVSGSMVSNIHLTARAKLKDFAENGEDALSLLPMRVRRAVVDCGLGSRAQARAAMESGRLSCSWRGSAIFWNGDMLPQLSSKTWAVLYEWAGKPAMPPMQYPPLKIRPLDGH